MATPSADTLSPCIAICRLDQKTGWCEGCYRTAAEIAGWLSKSEDERRHILALVAERRSASSRAAG